MKKLKQYVNPRLLIGIAGALLLAFLAFKAGELTGEDKAKNAHVDHNMSQKDEKEEVKEWTCSMDPQIRQNEPGSCPICGMDLIPVDQLGDSPVILEMTETAIELAGVETTPVQVSSPEKTVHLQGKVQVDERRISLITSRFPGRIEKLYVDFTGVSVSKGQKLASIYSPELVTAQQELFEAMKFRETNPMLYTAARNKLKFWNIADDQIDRIEQNGMPQTTIDVLAPVSGIVMERMATLGQYVGEGTRLFDVVDLSRVWILFDGYESDLPWLKVGDKIDYMVASLPGERFSGRISFIDPVVNPGTRAISVRVSSSNPGRKLKPEMFVTGNVAARMPYKDPQLIVPKSAVLWTGKRAVVYVAVEDVEEPMFQFREIELGPDLGTHFIVKSGIRQGENIVTNGAFKVDAAAQLAGKSSMINASMAGTSKSIMLAPIAFQQQLTLLVRTYMGLKDALVATDGTTAQQEASAVQKQLTKVEMHLLNQESHDTWMQLHDQLKNGLASMAGTNDVERQRDAFISVSDAISNAVEIFGIHGVNIYKDYCPMADDNKGAYWLSETEAIHNPYFGEKMMKCGKVAKVFKGKAETESARQPAGHNH